MRINAKVTILFSKEGLTINVIDDDAGITFCSLRLNQEQTCQALSRLGHCDTEECQVYGLDKVGKVEEIDQIEFLLGGVDYTRHVDEAKAIAKDRCPAGWTPDYDFRSQGSIFHKDNEWWARTTIRRWVEKSS